MNMTWFPITTSLWCPTNALRAMSLCTAIASSAFLAGGGEVQAQQRQSLQHDGKSFQVVQASEALSLLTADLNDPLAEQSELRQVGHGMVSDCDTGSCDSSGGGLFGNLRGSKRSAGYGSSAYGNACSPGGTCSPGSSCYGSGSCMACPTCKPYRYARVEAVLMRREGLSGFSRSTNFALDEYDFEWAPRVTIGSVPDCVNGTEISFVGPINWDMSSRINDTTGQTRLLELIPAAAIGAVLPEQQIGFTFLYDPEDITVDPGTGAITFNDNPADLVTLQRQRYESTYWSVETSKTMMAWDIAKFSFGGRYIHFEENYSFTAQNNVGATAAERGFLTSSATNNLLGVQVGLDVFTPIFFEHLSTFVRAKAGAYWNLAEGAAVVDDQGARLAGFSDDDGDLAAMIEISNGAQYQLGENLSVQCGTEFWYLTEVATAERQIPSLVGARAGSRGVDAGDDVVFLGFNFGATLKF